MVLSARERKGCRVILGKLLKEDLKSLARTVTEDQVSVDSKADAVKTIINHSESAAGLLGRRTIRKKILVQYLAAKGVKFSVTLHKDKIIEMILKFWTPSDAAPEDAGAIAGAMEGVGNLSIQETESVSDSKQDLPRRGRSRDAK